MFRRPNRVPQPYALRSRGGYTYQTKVLGYSPVAYYPMAESSGTTIIDISGNSYNGSYVGAVSVGASTGFDGQLVPTFNNGYGAIDAVASHITQSAFSLLVWVYDAVSSTSGGFECFGGVAKDGNNRAQMWRQTAGIGGYGYSNRGGTARFQASNVALPAATWTPLICVYTNAVDTFYWNNTSYTATTGGVFTAAFTLARISASETNSSVGSGHRMAHFALFNYALSAGQVADLQQAI